MVVALVVLGLHAGPLACSIPDSDLSRPGTCQPFELTATTPAPDSVDVLPNVAPALTFSDFPDPDTIGLSTFSLYTGFFYHTGEYWVDLVDRRAFFKPLSSLTLGLGYTVAVKPGIRSLRGCALDPANALPGVPAAPTISYRFQVVPAGVNHPANPVPPPVTTYQQVTTVFAAHCAGAACHLASGDNAAAPVGGCVDGAGGGLSLCARDAYAALVGIPSRQVNRLVLVAPRDSARSYLLRKIIGAPPVVGHVGVPEDTISRDDQRAIQDWIDNGALPAAQPGDGGV